MNTPSPKKYLRSFRYKIMRRRVARRQRRPVVKNMRLEYLNDCQQMIDRIYNEVIAKKEVMTHIQGREMFGENYIALQYEAFLVPGFKDIGSDYDVFFLWAYQCRYFEAKARAEQRERRAAVYAVLSCAAAVASVVVLVLQILLAR